MFKDSLKYLLGIFMLLMGVNKLVPFFAPVTFTGDAAQFVGALYEVEYLMPFIGAMEILAGALIVNRNTTPLGLLVLAPLSVNLLLFHLFLAPTTIIFAAVVFILNAYLVYKNRVFYTPLLASITLGKTKVKTELKNSDLVYG